MRTLVASTVCLAALGCKDIFSHCGSSHPKTPLDQNQGVLIHLVAALYSIFLENDKKM